MIIFFPHNIPQIFVILGRTILYGLTLETTFNGEAVCSEVFQTLLKSQSDS